MYVFKTVLRQAKPFWITTTRFEQINNNYFKARKTMKFYWFVLSREALDSTFLKTTGYSWFLIVRLVVLLNLTGIHRFASE